MAANNVKTDSLGIGIDKATRWYNGTNKDLCDIALKLYSETDLRTHSMKSMKTFEDALFCYVKDKYTGEDGICDYDTANNEKERIMRMIEDINKISPQYASRLKLDIVLNVLNKCSDMSVKDEDLYYLVFYTIKKENEKIDYNDYYNILEYYPDFKDIKENLRLTLTIKINDKYKYGVWFDVRKKSNDTLRLIERPHFKVTRMDDFLYCANKEIALHLGMYFGKLIFEAFPPCFNKNDNIHYVDFPVDQKADIPKGVRIDFEPIINTDIFIR